MLLETLGRLRLRGTAPLGAAQGQIIEGEDGVIDSVGPTAASTSSVATTSRQSTVRYSRNMVGSNGSRDYGVFLKSDASSKGSGSSTHMLRRASVALEEVIKEIEDGMKDEILLYLALCPFLVLIWITLHQKWFVLFFCVLGFHLTFSLTLQRNSDAAGIGNHQHAFWRTPAMFVSAAGSSTARGAC